MRFSLSSCWTRKVEIWRTAALSPDDFSVIESQLPADPEDGSRLCPARISGPLAVSPSFTIARPIFYEQLRIGTVAIGHLGPPSRRCRSRSCAPRLFCCAQEFSEWELFSLFLLARSISQPLEKIAAGMNSGSSQQLERAAGRLKELNRLVESIQKTQNLFKTSLDELERAKNRTGDCLGEVARREQLGGLTTQRCYQAGRESLRKRSRRCKPSQNI